MSAVPVIALGVRSQDEEPGRDSAGDQARLAAERALREPGRFLYAEPFVDHGSGFRGNRGEFTQAALDAAKRAAAEHGRAELWVFKSERLARGSGRKDEARSVMEVYVEMRRAGVDLRSVEDDHYFTNPMLIGVADAMAHKYAEDLSAHTRRGLAERKAKGRPVGAVPFGYVVAKTVVEGRVIASRVADEALAAVAVEMFESIAAGASPGDVARSLNARGIRTRRGKTWTARAVRQLIATDAYRGESGYGRIVDDAVWERANGSLRRLDPAAAQARRGGRPTTREYVLRGLAFCSCGAPLYAATDKYGSRGLDGKREPHYACKHRIESSGVCAALPIPASVAEYRVLEHLGSFVGDVEGWLAERSVDREDEQRDRQLSVVRALDELAKAERRVAKAEERLDAALDGDDDGIVEAREQAVARANYARASNSAAVEDAQAVAAEFDANPEEDAALALCSRLGALGGMASGALVLATVPTEEIRGILADALTEIRLWVESDRPDGLNLRAEFALRVGGAIPDSEGTSTVDFRAVPLPALAVPVGGER